MKYDLQKHISFLKNFNELLEFGVYIVLNSMKKNAPNHSKISNIVPVLEKAESISPMCPKNRKSLSKKREDVKSELKSIVTDRPVAKIFFEIKPKFFKILIVASIFISNVLKHLNIIEIP